MNNNNNKYYWLESLEDIGRQASVFNNGRMVMTLGDRECDSRYGTGGMVWNVLGLLHTLDATVYAPGVLGPLAETCAFHEKTWGFGASRLAATVGLLARVSRRCVEQGYDKASLRRRLWSAVRLVTSYWSQRRCDVFETSVDRAGRIARLRDALRQRPIDWDIGEAVWKAISACTHSSAHVEVHVDVCRRAQCARVLVDGFTTSLSGALLALDANESVRSIVVVGEISTDAVHVGYTGSYERQHTRVVRDANDMNGLDWGGNSDASSASWLDEVFAVLGGLRVRAVVTAGRYVAPSFRERCVHEQVSLIELGGLRQAHILAASLAVDVVHYVTDASDNQCAPVRLQQEQENGAEPSVQLVVCDGVSALSVAGYTETMAHRRAAQARELLCEVEALLGSDWLVPEQPVGDAARFLMQRTGESCAVMRALAEEMERDGWVGDDGIVSDGPCEGSSLCAVWTTACHFIVAFPQVVFLSNVT